MIPQTAIALLGFLFLVAPGLTFELVKERKQPSLPATTFREASRVALASLCFTLISLAVLTLLQRVGTGLLADPDEWAKLGTSYVKENYYEVAGTFLAELILACGLAAAGAAWISRSYGSTIQSSSTWDTFFSPPSSGAWTYVMVALSDGDRFFGRLAAYSPEHALIDRELTLEQPLRFQSPEDEKSAQFGNDWSYIIIPSSSIEYIAVVFRAEPELPTGVR